MPQTLPILSQPYVTPTPQHCSLISSTGCVFIVGVSIFFFKLHAVARVASPLVMLYHTMFAVIGSFSLCCPSAGG